MLTIDQVIETYGQSLGRIAAAYEADRALQEDLLQEMLIAIHRALPGLRAQERIAPYVFRVAHNRAASHVARQVGRRRADEGEAATQSTDQTDETPEAILLASERAGRLAHAIRRLPLPYRQVMTLLLEDLSYAEIAEALQISVANVGVRLNRAKAQLKELLDDR